MKMNYRPDNITKDQALFYIKVIKEKINELKNKNTELIEIYEDTLKAFSLYI